jgi:hypothetical protein
MPSVESILRWLLLAVAAERGAEYVTEKVAPGRAGDAEPQHPSVRFEPEDINPRNVLLTTGAGLLAGTLFLAAIVFPLFKYLAAYRAGVPPMLPAAGARIQEPPYPRLQQNPTLDLKSLRADEESKLNSYRWVDRAHGVVSIPIEQAIQLTARRGIAPRKAPPGKVYWNPQEGSRLTGFENKVAPEAR